MSRLVVYEGFIQARAEIRSECLAHNVDSMLRTIEHMPGVGSPLIPSFAQVACGPNVRKAVVSPFEIIYEYERESDTAYVYALLYCPSVQ